MAYTNYRFLRATGAAAIAETIVVNGVMVLVEVRLHLNAVGGVGAGAFTITIDSGVNAAYDVVLESQDMAAPADHVWRPANPVAVDDGDEIDFAWANANGKTYGLTIIYRDDL